MKIFDCFTFFNELELLEIRLNELKDVVDYHVIVESPFTHSGKRKTQYYKFNKERFADFAHKIFHVSVDDMPNTKNPWDNEKHQRQCIWRGLQLVGPGDIVMVSDADEIPSAKAIREKLEVGFDDYNIFEQKISRMYVNAVEGVWNGTKSFRFDGDKSLNLTDDIRYRKIAHPEDVTIKDAGWHFTYLGGAEKIGRKIEAFAHQELNNKKVLNRARIEKCLKDAIDPVHARQMAVEPLNNSYPAYLLEHSETKFKHLIREA